MIKNTRYFEGYFTTFLIYEINAKNIGFLAIFGKLVEKVFKNAQNSKKWAFFHQQKCNFLTESLIDIEEQYCVFI